MKKQEKRMKSFFSNHDLLSKIGHNVFKSHKEKELPTMHCAYILSICDIVLNPRSSGIKCSDRSVVRRVNAFLVNIRNMLNIIIIYYKMLVKFINYHYLTEGIRK